LFKERKPVARPIDHTRREALLDAAVDHVLEHGLGELSLRPLARALGVTTTTLVHHFGAKDDLLVAVMNGVRERLLAHAVPDDDDATAGRVTLDAWRWSSAPEHRALFRLFFEVYGMALQHPERFRPFLDRVVDDWLEPLGRFAEPGDDHDLARARATLGIAVVRGLLLDLLTTGDEERVERALLLFTGD
jgi:AcrR family transcriptional regulator